MRKLPPIILILLLLAPSAASETGLEVTIAETCPSDHEPLISMAAPEKTYSHPAPPGFYQYNVCVKGIDETSISNECEINEGFYLHSNKTEYAHFSSTPAYNVPVCTDKMVTTLSESCNDNQTALFSASNSHNAHVAEPGVFDNQVCGFFKRPENVTLSMEFNLSSSDEVYFDDEPVGEGRHYLAEFPYIVSEGDGFTAGIVADGMINVERELKKENELSMKRAKGEFFVPLTQGTRSDVERRQKMVLGNQFLDQLLPSFGFFMPSQARIKTSLDTEVIIESGIELGEGTHNLQITKTGENQVTIEQK